MARFTFLMGLLGSVVLAAPAGADWVILADGQRIEVQAFEIAERAVHITTLAGKRWSVLRDVVDVASTLAANEAPRPLDVVIIRSEPPVAAEHSGPAAPAAPPPPAPPAPRRSEAPPRPVSPPPPPQQPIVEREPTPVPVTESPRAAAPDRRYRFSLAINGVSGTEAVQYSNANQYTLFKEDASFETTYREPQSRGYEIGLFYRVAGPFAIGGTIQRFQNDREAVYTAALPHPFFFERFREVDGVASGLTNEETALHLDAVLTKTWGPLTLEAFGGPSWFRSRSEILVDVVYDEIFPYDEVVFRGVEGRVIESELWGFNVGASATFRIASIFGVDFGVRYSEARSQLTVEEGREIDLEVGGLRLGAGLRFLFP